MSKFFAIVVLPPTVDIRSADAVEQAVDRLMRPFEIWDGDDPTPPGHNGCWDYYWCCSKAWLVEDDRASDVYDGQEDLVFPVDRITEDGVVHALVTPDGKWHESNATYMKEDPDWDQKALALLRAHPAHFGVLAYCHS
ncbi:hypothetical protein [Rhizobacter sp. Root1221]|uniref:hypothetical protein n=1 Tax=Rhizobacter sp. Root1221 TaxID=1736433 RepID=UPI0006F396AD|nr:hypothetical protein [Rhizobacter sp. Root1221]KQV78298.1 hypothetical protein ASC87_11925 [Rhizobacter sp. Root1221]